MPNEYYSMLPKDFAAMIEGYGKKLYRESSEQRRAAFIIISPHVKDLSYQKFCRDFWHLEMDDILIEKQQEDGEEVSSQLFEQIMQTHNKKWLESKRKKQLNK